MKKKNGQAVVLFAVVLVGMLGFVALGIDGGMILTESSKSQSTSDTIALTAAQSLVENGFSFATATNDALSLANSSGYNNDGTNNTVSVSINGPVTEGSATVYYVNTSVHSKVKTTFAQLFIQDQIEQTTTSQVRVIIYSGSGPIFDGYGVLALDSSKNTPLKISGGSDLYSGGGGVYSANNFSLSGGSNIYTEGGTIYMEADFTVTGGTQYDTDGGDVITQGDLTLTGASRGYTDGGNIYANGDINNISSYFYGGTGQAYSNGNIKVTGGSKFYEWTHIQSAGILDTPGTWYDVSSEIQWATPLTNMPPITIPSSTPTVPTLPTPDCSGMPDYGKFKGTWQDSIIQPGNYDSISQGSGAQLTMLPGIYCVSGNITLNGGSDTIANGVFIYLYNGGKFQINGGADLVHTAPNSLTDSAGNEWGGMAMYLDPDSNTSITMNGGSNSSYSGTFYAPGSDCSWSGGVDPSLNKAQLACATVTLSGGTDVKFTYDGDLTYQGGNGTPIITLEFIK